MAPASRINRSGSSPGRSPVSVRIRVAIARAASAHARSATAACSTPRSDSSAVFGLPSSSALSTAFQAAARGSAGASSAWASGMVMGWTPSKSAARASKTGTVQSMSITIRMRRTPTMRMARSSGTEQQTKRFTTREVYGAGPVSLQFGWCHRGGKFLTCPCPRRVFRKLKTRGHGPISLPLLDKK